MALSLASSDKPSVRTLQGQRYDDANYWDSRYLDASRSATFDWHCDLSHLREHLKPHLRKGIRRILIIGCGNSQLPAHLWDAGFHSITALDICAITVRRMVSKFKSARPGLDFLCLDARAMSRLHAETFDLVIDKACMDAMFCSDGHFVDVSAMLHEVNRVLVPSGRFVSLSHGSPLARIPLLQSKHLPWRVAHTRVPVPILQSSRPNSTTNSPQLGLKPPAGCGEAGTEAHHSLYLYACSKLQDREKVRRISRSADVELAAENEYLQLLKSRCADRKGH